MNSAEARGAPQVTGRRRRRLRGLIVALVAFMVIYLPGGFLGVPWAANRWVLPAINGAIPGTLEVEEIAFNPLSLTLNLGRGRLTSPEGTTLLEFDALRCGVSPIWSVLTASWCVRELIIERPSLSVVIDEEGDVDLLRALVTPGAATSAEPKPLISRIPHLRIACGEVRAASARFTDRSRGEVFEASWSDINFDFGSLDLRPHRRSGHLLTARSTNGATARWEGSFTVDPPTARGEVTIEGFPIAPLMPYLARATSATIVDGLLDARLRYEAAPTDRPAVLRASIPMATLERLRILDGRDLLIESPRLTLTDADLDLVARTANIRSLRLLNSTLHLVRAEDGRPAILRLFPWADREGLAALEEMHGRDDDQGADLTEFPVERVAAAVNAIVRGATGEWTIDLKSLALHDQVVSYIDRSPRRVVETTLRRARLDAGPIRSAQELAAPFLLEGVLGTNGALRLEGMLRPLSAKVEVQVDADEIDLTPFAPYLPPQFLQDLPPTELTDGVARVAGRVVASVDLAADTISVDWRGAALLRQLELSFAERQPLLALQAIAADGHITALLQGDESVNASWDGEAHLEGLSLGVPLPDLKAETSLEGATAKGQASIHLVNQVRSEAAWSGAFSTKALAARAERSDLNAAAQLATFKWDGALRVVAGEGESDPLRVTSEGLIHATAAAGTVRQDGGDRSAAMSSFKLDGNSTLRRVTDGSAHLEWIGRFDFDQVSAETPLAPAGVARVECGALRYAGVVMASSSPDGTASARSEGALTAVRAQASAEGTEFGALTAGAEELTYAGVAAIERGAAVDALRERSTSDAPGAQATRALPSRGSSAAPSAEPMPLLVAAGEVTGRELALAAPRFDDAQVSIGHLRASHIDLVSIGPRVEVGEVVITRARAELARALIGPMAEGESSATDERSAPSIADDRTRAPEPTAPATTTFEHGLDTSSLPEVLIRRLELADAFLRLVDLSTSPAATLLVSEVNAEIDGLGTRAAEPAELTMTGLVQEAGRFDLRGTLDPVDPTRQTDIQFTLSSLPLKPYDPYANRFVGHEIDSGRLAVQMPVSIHEAQLRGTLDATLDRFFLGRSVPSPEAINLPVKLGLDLLRDGDQRIAVSVPFEGDLRDPSFRLGGVIWQAIVNLILRATTAPFTLLAALVGAGDRDLSMVLFEPGSSELTSERSADIDMLAKALNERPALSLRVVGITGASADEGALRAAGLDDRLRAAAGRETSGPIQGEARRSAISRAYALLPAEVRTAVEAKSGSRPPVEAMERALLDSIEIDDQAWQAIARARAEAVARELITVNGISEERITVDVEAGDAEGPPRVAFEIR